MKKPRLSQGLEDAANILLIEGSANELLILPAGVQEAIVLGLGQRIEGIGEKQSTLGGEYFVHDEKTSGREYAITYSLCQ